MLASLARALFGGALLFAAVMAWVGVQTLARKSDGRPPDCDMLGDTEGRCAHCNLRDACAHETRQAERGAP